MKPIALTDTQLDIITRATGPLHPVDTARFWGRPPNGCVELRSSATASSLVS
jgi:hypothetical protein